jgi:hypothetical protein
MRVIYTYIPETNHVPREHRITAILVLLFMVRISLVPALTSLYLYVSTSVVCVQCPIWLFSVVSELRDILVIIIMESV